MNAGRLLTVQLGVVAALVSSVHAEPRTPITFSDALDAIARAPAAVPPAATVAAARANADAARAWPSPSARVGTTRLTEKLMVGASLPLPVFGTVRAAHRRAVAEADVARDEASVELRSLRGRVAHAWIELARADGALVAAINAAQQADELELIANGRKSAGVGADVDVTTAHAAKARADVEVGAANRMLDAASAELAGLLGWDPARPLRAEGPLVTGRSASLSALRAKLLAHPEHVLAADRAKAAALGVREVRSARWPTIALDTELRYDDRSMTEGATPWERTDVTVGLAIELPVFAHVGDRVRAARAQNAAATAREVAVDAELSATLYATYARWQAASLRLDALERDVVPAQERAAALAAQAFREGARDLAYALQAQRDLAAVRADVNTARADAAAAFADLQLAAGEEVGHAP